MASESKSTSTSTASSGSAAADAACHAMEMAGYSFSYAGKPPSLSNVSFQLPLGCRCILTGDNGAGKSTLLRILAGKHMHPRGQVKNLGREAFHDMTLNNDRAYLASDWARRTIAFAGYSTPFQADIAVKDLMVRVQEDNKERRDMLLDLLRIDLNWRMHEVSDGQRRRVQIFLHMLTPSKLVILDEVTSDLDVITRTDFLQFLKTESDERGVSIIYATHIFDGLDEWGTHLAYLDRGRLTRFSTWDECKELQEHLKSGCVSPLHKTIADYIRADRASAREEADKAGADKGSGAGALARVAVQAEPTVKRGSRFGSGEGYVAGRMYSHFQG